MLISFFLSRSCVFTMVTRTALPTCVLWAAPCCAVLPWMPHSVFGTWNWGTGESGCGFIWYRSGSSLSAGDVARKCQSVYHTSWCYEAAKITYCNWQSVFFRHDSSHDSENRMYNSHWSFCQSFCFCCCCFCSVHCSAEGQGLILGSTL